MRHLGHSRDVAPVGLALLALWLAAPEQLFAQGGMDDEDAKKGFQFKLDPAIFEPFYTDVDTDSAKFEEYRDMDSAVTVPRLHIFGRSEDGNRYLDIDASHIERADARYTLRYGLGGRYKLTLDRNEIPHRFGNDGTFLLSRTQPGVFEFPDPVRGAFQEAIDERVIEDRSTINLAFLRGLLQPFIDTADKVDLRLERERTDVRLDVGSLKKFRWGARVFHETREGTRPYGGSFGFSNIIELPEPIDYDTVNLDLNGEYRGDRSGVQFGYRLSTFQNHIDSVLYDNPFRLTDSTSSGAYSAPNGTSIGGPSYGLNALPPDNVSHNVNLSGQTKLSDHSHARGRVSYTRMAQDERLAAYGTNTAINVSSGAPFDVTDVANLPVSNADAKVGVLSLDADVSTDVGEDGDLAFRWRYYDYDNQTTRIEFPGYVRFDAVWEEIGRITVPYSYRRQNVEVDFGWNLGSRNRAGIAYVREMWGRDFREVASSHEDGVRLTFNSRPSQRLTLFANYTFAKRNIDAYEVEAQLLSFTHDEDVNNQPTLRKFDEAARTLNKGMIQAQLMPGDRVNLTFSFAGTDQSYDESELGLLSDQFLNFGAELGYTPSEKLSLLFFAHREARESFQKARQSGATLSTSELDTWELTLTEDTDTVGFSVDGACGKAWKGSFLSQWSNSNGTSEFFTLPGGTPATAQGFDDYDDNAWLTVSAQLGYDVNDHVQAGVRYVRENFTTNRFLRTGLVEYLPGSLILNDNDGDYMANIASAYLKIRF